MRKAMLTHVTVGLLATASVLLAGCARPPSTGREGAPPPKPPDMMPKMPSAAATSGKKAVMVIAPEGFRDEEYAIPKKALGDAGFAVTTVSLSVGECKGTGGMTVQAEKAAREVSAADFDGVIFVGGPGMVQHLNDPALTALAKQFADAGKLVAAICVAPVILANAGVLDGIEATVWADNRGDLQAKGAVLSDKPVVTSGRIVTANGPDAAPGFATAVVDALKAQ
jgi:protease I